MTQQQRERYAARESLELAAETFAKAVTPDQPHVWDNIYSDLSKAIDRVCKDHGVNQLGT